MRVIYKRGPYAVRHVYDKSRRDRWAIIRPDEPRWRDNTRPTLDPEEAKRRCNLLAQSYPLGDIPRPDRDEVDPSWRDDPPYSAHDLGIRVRS